MYQYLDITGQEAIPITKRYKQQFTPGTSALQPIHNQPVNRTCCCLDCGRRPERLEKTHASVESTNKLAVS